MFPTSSVITTSVSTGPSSVFDLSSIKSLSPKSSFAYAPAFVSHRFKGHLNFVSSRSYKFLSSDDPVCLGFWNAELFERDYPFYVNLNGYFDISTFGSKAVLDSVHVQGCVGYLGTSICGAAHVCSYLPTTVSTVRLDSQLVRRFSFSVKDMVTLNDDVSYLYFGIGIMTDFPDKSNVHLSNAFISGDIRYWDSRDHVELV